MRDPYSIPSEGDQDPMHLASSQRQAFMARLRMYVVSLVLLGLVFFLVPKTAHPAVFTLLVVVLLGTLVAAMVTASRLAVNSARSAVLMADLQRGKWEGAQRANLGHLLTPVSREPGRMMAVRLRPTVSLMTEIAGLGCFALFWNAVVSVFVVVQASEWLAGRTPWALTLFLAPFVIIGASLLVVLIGKILAYARVPVPVLELEREPLVPGERVRMHLSQSGQISLNTLTVELRCLEEIRYTRGTDTYTDRRDVHTERLLDTGPLDLGLTRKLEQPLEFRIPEQGPVSFQAPHNALIWRLEVGLDVRKWPNARWEFPFRVVPESVRHRL